jgi:GT2 family glycosyltransferase
MNRQGPKLGGAGGPNRFSSELPGRQKVAAHLLRSPFLAGDTRMAQHDLREQISYGTNTCNSIYRRAALLEIGLFDEESPGYADENDVDWRLRRIGYEILYLPDAKITHMRQFRSVGSFASYLYKVGYGKGYIALKRAKSMIRDLSFKPIITPGIFAFNILFHFTIMLLVMSLWYSLAWMLFSVMLAGYAALSLVSLIYYLRTLSPIDSLIAVIMQTLGHLSFILGQYFGALSLVLKKIRYRSK